MKVITIDDPVMERKAYLLDEDEQQYTEFTPGIDVLPAMYYSSEVASGNFYFVAKHEPGERFWKDGGYECVDDHGMKRAFHLDALIVHPRTFQGKTKAKVEIDEDKPKGKRGRPPIDPSLKKITPEYKSTGNKRGRPAADPALRKSYVYVPTGGKRGRPSKAK
jgi:hypothetical protein